jgi:hypothetical protein
MIWLQSKMRGAEKCHDLMKPMTRKILIGFCFAILGVATLLVICLQVHLWRHHANINAFTKRFEIVRVHTNDANGILIVERKTSQPIWGSLALGTPGEPDTLSFFFEGKNIMNVYPQLGAPPHFDVSFFDEDGAVSAVWVSRGTNAGFTERRLIGGDKPRKDVWFNEAWHTLQHRTNDGNIQGGIVLDGKWHHLKFTNGAVLIVP